MSRFHDRRRKNQIIEEYVRLKDQDVGIFLHVLKIYETRKGKSR